MHPDNANTLGGPLTEEQLAAYVAALEQERAGYLARATTAEVEGDEKASAAWKARAAEVDAEILRANPARRANRRSASRS
jgi:hypothetical protein